MVTSCTGHVLDNQRATTRGVFSSGSHLVTLHFQPHPFKEANPLMFVRIIALPTARVMNTNNSRCSPWEDKKQ